MWQINGLKKKYKKNYKLQICPKHLYLETMQHIHAERYKLVNTKQQIKLKGIWDDYKLYLFAFNYSSSSLPVGKKMVLFASTQSSLWNR